MFKDKNYMSWFKLSRDYTILSDIHVQPIYI